MEGLLNIIIYFTLCSCRKPFIIRPDDTEYKTCFGNTFQHEHTKWNNTISPKVYQESYCALRCSSEGKRVALRLFNHYDQNLNCLDCSCKRPECEYYGICCPSIEEDFVPLPEFEIAITYVDDIYGNKHLSTNNSSEEIDNFNDTSQHLRFSNGRDREDFPTLGCFRIDVKSSFLYIRSCFKDFKGVEEIVRFCEETVSHDEVNVDYFAWAVDTATHVVYRNMYCAMCNGAIQPHQLAVRTNCTDFMPFYQITDPDEMLRRTLNATGGCCDLTVDNPDTNDVFSCNRNFFQQMKVPVSSCDSAPPEWHYDEDIARACQELNHTTYRVITLHGGRTFKNIFCAVCNLNAYPQYGLRDQECIAGFESRYSLPFSLLINFGKGATVLSKIPSQKTLFKYATCSNMEWSSPDAKCLPLVCSPGKLLFNGRCTSAFTNIDGLRYRIRFWLFRPNYLSNLTSDSLKEMNDLMMKVRLTLWNFGYVQSIKIGNLSDNSTQIESPGSSDMLKHVICVEIYLVALKGVKRDDCEKQIIESLIDEEGNFKLKEKWNVYFPMDLFWSNPNTAGALDRFTMISPPYSYGGNPCIVDLTKFISVKRHLLCSYISFRTSHYNITIEYRTLPPGVKVALDLNVTKVNFSTISELNMIEVDKDGNLNVCREVLDTKLNEMEEVYKKSTFEYRLSELHLAQYIVTMISLGCSIVCLIVTVLIYLCLPILQNTAGKYNLFLCLSLLLAQTSLIIIAHRPREDNICMLTGIMTHFLWLWMFSWTFICSFHMFNVFTSYTRSQPATKREEKKQLMKRIICSLIGPTAIVISVIVVSVISSGGEHIGYSHDTCYLTSELFVGCSVIFPIALSLACNITFFVRTVFSINKVRRLQTSQGIRADKQQDLLVYVKLSSLTGVSWTMAIVAEATDVDTLRLISILLNGFQGVFIFLSCICNKRVLKLFKKTNLQTGTTDIATTTLSPLQEVLD